MRLHFVGKGRVLITMMLTLLFFVSGMSDAAGQGQELFETNCKSCHHPDKKVIGPKLRGIKAKWEEEAGDPTLIYTWIRNWEDAVAISPYAATVAAKEGSNMKAFPSLTDADIDAILDYADNYVEPTGDGGGDSAGSGEAGEEESGMSYWWFVLGGVLLVVIFAAAGVRRQLRQVQKVQTGEDDGEKETYGDILKGWAKENQGLTAAIGVVALFSLLVVSYGWLKGIGVYTDYNPSQPVSAFSHNIHAEINGIDCQYCHNSASDSKHAGIPTMNVCMNCHRSIEGASEEGKKSVEYLREMAGFDGVAYTGESQAIAWNRVYVLPDHVYFNHSQHVNVGGLECQNCHGPVEKMTTARIAKASELKPVGDIPENQLTRPTLTMGWCIECHNNTAVTVGADLDQDPSKISYYEEIHRRLKKRSDIYKKYLDDEKVTVRELGGWECSKCHY